MGVYFIFPLIYAVVGLIVTIQMAELSRDEIRTAFEIFAAILIWPLWLVFLFVVRAYRVSARFFGVHTPS